MLRAEVKKRICTEMLFKMHCVREFKECLLQSEFQKGKSR